MIFKGSQRKADMPRVSWKGIGAYCSPWVSPSHADTLGRYPGEQPSGSVFKNLLVLFNLSSVSLCFWPREPLGPSVRYSRVSCRPPKGYRLGISIPVRLIPADTFGISAFLFAFLYLPLHYFYSPLYSFFPP